VRSPSLARLQEPRVQRLELDILAGTAITLRLRCDLQVWESERSERVALRRRAIAVDARINSNVVRVDQMEARASEAQPRRVLSARRDADAYVSTRAPLPYWACAALVRVSLSLTEYPLVVRISAGFHLAPTRYPQ
jgi:hypothetical protein